MEDNVPTEIKKRRLREIIDLQQIHSEIRMNNYVGKVHEVLIEGDSKKSDKEWMGRNTQNAVVVFPKTGNEKPGDFVQVLVKSCTTATLLGKMIN